MKKMGKTLLAAALMGAMATAVQADDKTLHVYNWSDYIAPDTIANFEKQTDIKVNWSSRNRKQEARLFEKDGSFDIYSGPLAGITLQPTNCSHAHMKHP